MTRGPEKTAVQKEGVVSSQSSGELFGPEVLLSGSRLKDGFHCDHPVVKSSCQQRLGDGELGEFDPDSC